MQVNCRADSAGQARAGLFDKAVSTPAMYCTIAKHIQIMLSYQYSISRSFLPTSLLCTTFSLALSAPSSFAFKAWSSIPASKKPSAVKRSAEHLYAQRKALSKTYSRPTHHH